MTSGNPGSRQRRHPTGQAGWLLTVLLALAALALTLVPIAFLTTDHTQTAQAAEPIDTATLRLIDDRTRITLAAFRLNRVTNTYLGTATLTNTGAEALPAPLYLVVASVTPAGASVVGAHGLTTDGKPYFDLTGFIPGGTLAPAAVAKSLSLQMKNPTAAPIQLGLHLYARAPPVNRPPTANAGPDQTAPVGRAITLDGSGSTDPEGRQLRFDWSFLSRPTGSTAVLSGPTLVNPSFSIDRFGDYQIQLIVNDGTTDSAPATVAITTQNTAPVANAGPDQSGFVGDPIHLSGSASTDVDGDPLTYLWSLVNRPADSTAVLSDTSAVAPSFALDWPGTYVAQLIVNDGALDSAPDTVAVSTENSRPVANAGPDRSAFVGDTLTLDGTASTDADQDQLSYAWSLLSRPVGSAAALTGAATASPHLTIDRRGSYVAQLQVNDGHLDSAPDTATVTTGNVRPVADAGQDQTATVGAAITLDGAGSSDADGDPLDYQWSLLSVPSGSAASLADPAIETPGFIADLAGLYIAQLVVSDGDLTSDPDTSTVEVLVPNRAPRITSIPTTAATVGQAYRYDGDATDPDGGDTLTWSLDTAPAGATIDPGTGLIQWTPAPAQVGNHPVAVRVQDQGGLSDTQSFTVSVAAPPPPANEAPVITSTPVTGATAGHPYAYDLDATDPDTGDVLTYSLATAPAGMTIDPATGLIGWTPTAGQTGDHPITVRATDHGGLFAEQGYTLTVVRDNQAPVAVDDAYTMQQGETLVIADLAAPAAVTGHLAQAEPAAAAHAAASYGQLPLAFEANAGQTDPRVRFLARGQGYTLFLTDDEAVLVLSPPRAKSGARNPFQSAAPDPADRRPGRDAGTQAMEGKPSAGMLAQDQAQGPTSSTLPDQDEQPAEPRVLRLKLLGANAAPRATGLDPLPGRSNYFIGNDPSAWRAGVPTYGKVALDAVYPGIGVVYYGNQRQLEYDFVVAPGADPGQIRLAVEGADKVGIDESGNLVLSTPDGEIRQHKPAVYQEIDGERRALDGRYVLLAPETVGWAPPAVEVASWTTVGDTPIKGDSSAAQSLEVAYVGFEVGKYDRNQPLVIDPVLEYATYLGGTSGDRPYGIAVDRAGNAYVAGHTMSANFPIVGGVQSTYAGGDMDVFVTKISADGSTLVYSTFIGGAGTDAGQEIAIDETGNTYVTGQVYSANFPVVNALQANYGGGSDAFILKLDATGSGLVYSSYLGGAGKDFGQSIAVDAVGAAYIAGVTASPSFPIANALQPGYGGGPYWGDAFAAKVLPDGSGLAYSTFLGGVQDEMAYGIAVDDLGSAFVAGWTSSSNFPTANALQPQHGGRATRICGTATCGGDAFVAKLSPMGDSLVYSTFLGGMDDDAAYAVAVDVAGNTYVTGQTHSPDFPVANPIQPTISTGFDAFVAKFNPDGSALVYSTYIGGTGTDPQSLEKGHGIAADPAGNAYVEGETDSRDFPLVDPIQSSFGGGRWDTFVAKFSPMGERLSFSTYLGGNAEDGGFAIAVDQCGDVYSAADVLSSNMPTVSPLQASYAGGSGAYGGDAYVAKLRFDNVTDLAITKTDAPDPVIAGNELRYTLTVSNLCKKAATGVTLADTLPPQITLVSATPTQGSCAQAAGKLTCDLGGIAGLASAEVTLVATVNAHTRGAITNQASVTADQDDPDPRNNSATATTNTNPVGRMFNLTQKGAKKPTQEACCRKNGGRRYARVGMMARATLAHA